MQGWAQQHLEDVPAQACSHSCNRFSELGKKVHHILLGVGALLQTEASLLPTKTLNPIFLLQLGSCPNLHRQYFVSWIEIWSSACIPFGEIELRGPHDICLFNKTWPCSVCVCFFCVIKVLQIPRKFCIKCLMRCCSLAVTFVSQVLRALPRPKSVSRLSIQELELWQGKGAGSSSAGAPLKLRKTTLMESHS